MQLVQLSEFKARCHRVQQLEFLKLTIFIVLTVQLVGAVNYCSICKNHVACSNKTGVCIFLIEFRSSELFERIHSDYFKCLFS